MDLVRVTALIWGHLQACCVQMAPSAKALARPLCFSDLLTLAWFCLDAGTHFIIEGLYLYYALYVQYPGRCARNARPCSVSRSRTQRNAAMQSHGVSWLQQCGPGATVWQRGNCCISADRGHPHPQNRSLGAGQYGRAYFV